MHVLYRYEFVLRILSCMEVCTYIYKFECMYVYGNVCICGYRNVCMCMEMYVSVDIGMYVCGIICTCVRSHGCAPRFTTDCNSSDLHMIM